MVGPPREGFNSSPEACPRFGFQGIGLPNDSTDSGCWLKKPFGSSGGTSGLAPTQPGVQPTAYAQRLASLFGTPPSSFGSSSNVFGSNSGTVNHNFGLPSPVKGTPFVHGEASTLGFGSSSTPAIGTSSTTPGAFGSNVFGSNIGTVSHNFGLPSPVKGTPFGFGHSSAPVFGTSTTPSLFGGNVFGSNSGTVSPNLSSSGRVTGAPLVHQEASTSGFGLPSTPSIGTSTTPSMYGSNVFGSNCGTVSPNISSSSLVTGTPLVHGEASTRGFGLSSTPSIGTSTTSSLYGSNVFGSNSGTVRQDFGSLNPVAGIPFVHGAASIPSFQKSSSPFEAYTTASFHSWNSFDKQQGGSSISPYSATVAAEEKVCSTNGVLVSISAMNAYCDKSHEEIRLEDYQQQRKGPVVFNKSNWQPSPKSSNSSSFDPFGQHHSNGMQAFKNNVPNEKPSHSNASSLFPGFQVPYQPSSNVSNCSPFGKSTSAFQTSGTSNSVSTSESLGFGRFSCKCNQSNPFAQPVSMGQMTQPFALYGFPAFVTFIQPGTVAAPAQQSSLFGPTVASFTPLLGTHTSPATVPFAGPNTNFASFNSPNGVYSTPGFYGPPSVALGMLGAQFSNGAPSHSPANVASPVIGSFGSPSTSFVGISSPYTCNGPNEARSTAPSSVATNPFSLGPSSNTNPFLQQFEGLREISVGRIPLFGTVAANKEKEADEACHVPTGSEVIVEKLGFNPFSQGKDNDTAANKHDYGEKGEFLPCEEAEKDDDIIALAEFAVEQHNALHKHEEVSFVKVVAACLEAVGGGRYHIVVEALVAGSLKRHYAVVFRKGTERPNYVTVLEKWLPSQA